MADTHTSETSENSDISDISEEGSALALRRRRAAYRALHRGSKEMDWLVGRFAQAAIPTMDGLALETFERFLALSDGQIFEAAIHGAFQGGEPAKNSEFAGILQALRRFHGLPPAPEEPEGTGFYTQGS